MSKYATVLTLDRRMHRVVEAALKNFLLSTEQTILTSPDERTKRELKETKRELLGPTISDILLQMGEVPDR